MRAVDVEGGAEADVVAAVEAVEDAGLKLAIYAEAGARIVVAKVLDQYKGKKQLVFKFKKRKGYKKLKGHRQQLTKVRITAVGADKYEAPAKAAKAEEAASEE